MHWACVNDSGYSANVFGIVGTRNETDKDIGSSYVLNQCDTSLGLCLLYGSSTYLHIIYVGNGYSTKETKKSY